MDIRINLTAEELIKIKSISWPLGVTDAFIFGPRQIELPFREQSLRFGSQVNRPHKCLITNVIALGLTIRQKGVGGVLLNLHV